MAYTTVGVCVTTGLVSRWLRRGLVVSASARWGLAVAAACAGFAAVEIFCPYTGTGHILTSHLLPAAVAGAAAAFAALRR
jgi:hypothetical protein